MDRTNAGLVTRAPTPPHPHSGLGDTMGAVASGDISHTVVTGRSRDRQYSPSLSRESPVSAQPGSGMGPGVMESGNEFKKSSAPYWLCGLKELASPLWASVSSPER